MKTSTPTPKDAASALTITARHAADHQPLTPEELGSLSYFAGLGNEEIQEIAKHTKISHFAAGESVMTQRDLADRFYVILSGRVAIECDLLGRRSKIEEIGPGAAVGFSWLFEPEKVHFSAHALEPVEAVFVYGTLLRAECERRPHLGYELAKRTGRIMLERLEALTAMIGGE